MRFKLPDKKIYAFLLVLGFLWSSCVPSNSERIPFETLTVEPAYPVVTPKVPIPKPTGTEVKDASLLTFEQLILDDSYLAYQRDIGDIDGDGMNDIVGVSGDIGKPTETLSWFQYPGFERKTLVDFKSFGVQLRCDDMKLHDIDGDGDLDVVTRVGIGDIEGTVVWFENPRPANEVSSIWLRHDIGSNAYTKDVVVRDFDGDNKPDVVTREDTATQIWFQDTPDNWVKVEFLHHSHEGMDVGDLDKDGDPDIVLNGFWYETPGEPRKGVYIEHNIDDNWWNQSSGSWQDNSSKVVVADINSDGNLDVILSNSEKPGYPVSWYFATDPKNGPWTKQIVVDQCDYCHNLQAADFNNDGYMDILAGGMPTSQNKGLTLYLGGDSDRWEPFVIQDLGSYSAEIGDIGNDGDVDIVTIRNYETLPTELWVNKTDTASKSSLESWSYIQVSDNHNRVFGLTFDDVDGDGMIDILSGTFWYQNPGGDMTGNWTQNKFPLVEGKDVDALLALDVDSDAFADVIAMNKDGGVYWLEATNNQGKDWNIIDVGKFPMAVHHISSQGYKLAQITPEGKPEVVLVVPDPNSGNDSIWYFKIPPNPDSGNWPKIRIAGDMSSNRTQGVGVGDVDGDGKVDVSGGFLDTDGKTKIAWWKNPGDGSPNWQRYPVGETHGLWPDRLEIAEISGDGRPDIIVTEEDQPVKPIYNTYWFEQLANPTNLKWVRRTIATQFSTNSMDVTDMDHDGDMDIITGEHRGTKKVAIWENINSGTEWVEHIVSEGKESHLGVRAVDLDNDGDLDIVSIAWDDFQYVHLWRNDEIQSIN